MTNSLSWELIRKLQPATLVNDRIGQLGDYQTPEQFIPNAISYQVGVRLHMPSTRVFNSN